MTKSSGPSSGPRTLVEGVGEQDRVGLGGRGAPERGQDGGGDAHRLGAVPFDVGEQQAGARRGEDGVVDVTAEAGVPVGAAGVDGEADVTHAVGQRPGEGLLRGDGESSHTVQRALGAHAGVRRYRRPGRDHGDVQQEGQVTRVRGRRVKEREGQGGDPQGRGGARGQPLGGQERPDQQQPVQRRIGDGHGRGHGELCSRGRHQPRALCFHHIPLVVPRSPPFPRTTPACGVLCQLR
ncbi:hypothetical protein RB200_28530 [Streptomyces sp. PmtG]